MDLDPVLYANTMGINPYEEYKPSEAARLIRVGISQLRKAKNDGEIDVIMTGDRNYIILGLDLVRWKLKKRIKSATTISPKTAQAHGVELGTTTQPSSVSQLACAQRILSPQSRH